MIPKIRSILYTTDLTKNSAYAFRYAVNSAMKHDAKIHILYVLEKLTPSEEATLGVFARLPQLEKVREKKKNEQMNMIKKRLSKFAKLELKDNPAALKRVASISVVDGDPADEILKRADDPQFDIVVMGTHGKGWLRHTFMGSVCEKVLRRIRKPVFVIPLPEEDTDISFNTI